MLLLGSHQAHDAATYIYLRMQILDSCSLWLKVVRIIYLCTIMTYKQTIKLLVVFDTLAHFN